MGYDNSGAWTDLVNGIDYVDAKDINDIAHKMQELKDSNLEVENLLKRKSKEFEDLTTLKVEEIEASFEDRVEAAVKKATDKRLKSMEEKLDVLVTSLNKLIYGR